MQLKVLDKPEAIGRNPTKLIMKLLEFDFYIQYKKGAKNYAENALSRKNQHAKNEI
jgi:hypothetical protein